MTILSRLLTPAPRRPAPSARRAGFDFSAVLGQTLDVLQNNQFLDRHFQRQWLATFMACLMLVSGVAGIYLNVTANAAIAGREIQNLEEKIAENERRNADLQTQIAGTLSNISLEERAAAAGFTPLTRDNIEYLVVPGYVPPQRAQNLAPAQPAAAAEISNGYTETLFGWLARQLDSASTPLARNR